MKKLISTRNIDKESWLKYRKQGIGGFRCRCGMRAEPIPYCDSGLL